MKKRKKKMKKVNDCTQIKNNMERTTVRNTAPYHH